jgi:hypothetical protein
MSKTMILTWSREFGMRDVDAPDWHGEMESATDDEWEAVRDRVIGHPTTTWGDVENYGVEVHYREAMGYWVLFWHPAGLVTSYVWVPKERDFLDFAIKYIAPWIAIGMPDKLSDTLEVIKNIMLEHVEHHGPTINEYTGRSQARERRELNARREQMRANKTP